MLIFDRIVLVVLALGIWTLVLTPQEIGAHHQEDDGHSCDVSGEAYGEVDGGAVYVDGSGLSVDCTHY